MSAARVLFRSGVSVFFACEQLGGVICHIGIGQGIVERLTIVVLAQSLPAKCIAYHGFQWFAETMPGLTEQQRHT